MNAQKHDSSEKPAALIGEVISKADSFNIAYVLVHGEDRQFAISRKFHPALDWDALVPAQHNMGGIVKGTGTTVKFTVDTIGRMESCEILNIPAPHDAEKVMQGEFIRKQIFLDMLADPQADVLIIVDDEDEGTYAINPEKTPVSILKNLKSMTIGSDQKWIKDTGTKLRFKVDRNGIAHSIEIIAQPENHPDDQTELDGLITIYAHDGAIIEHKPTGMLYQLNRCNASEAFWERVKTLYGAEDPANPRTEPEHPIPVRFKRTAEREVYSANLIPPVAEPARHSSVKTPKTLRDAFNPVAMLKKFGRDCAFAGSTYAVPASIRLSENFAVLQDPYWYLAGAIAIATTGAAITLGRYAGGAVGMGLDAGYNKLRGQNLWTNHVRKPLAALTGTAAGAFILASAIMGSSVLDLKGSPAPEKEPLNAPLVIPSPRPLLKT